MNNEALMTPNFYTTLQRTATAESKDRGSKFIACSFPIVDVNDFKNHLAGIKKEHPKASHYCFAYRIGIDGTNFRVSDDGEPSGSAGRPILGQLDSKQVTDALIIVVRYFGGTLLGIPGLINAYKTAASLVLQVTPFVQKPILVRYKLQFDYTQLNEVMKVIKQFDCIAEKQDLNLFCNMELGISVGRQDEVLFKLREIRGVEFSLI